MNAISEIKLTNWSTLPEGEEGFYPVFDRRGWPRSISNMPRRTDVPVNPPEEPDTSIPSGGLHPRQEQYFSRCGGCGGDGICTRCIGLGTILCNVCGGSGNVRVARFGVGFVHEPCPTCSASGKLPDANCNGSGKCPYCRGTGRG